MSRKLNHIYLVLPIIIAVLLTACHSSRHSLTSSQQSSQTQTGPTSINQQIQKLVGDVEQWQDVSLPVKCKIRSPKNISISGRATMIRGHQIAVSLRMLGFEVAGLYVDTDSIYVYEKINKTMIVAPMSKITAETGLTVSDLQDLITGRLCYPGYELSTSNILDLYELSTDNSAPMSLKPKANKPWVYTIAESNPLSLESLYFEVPGKVTATCSYEQFSPVINGFCKSVSINATAGRNNLDATFEWQLADAKVDTGLSPNVPSLKSYHRITFAQLIKALGSL